LIILTAISLRGTYAQDRYQSVGDSSAFDIELPPLSVLIDSACLNNAFVQYRDLDILVQEGNLKTDRTYWLRNFGLQTDVRYGTFDNFRSSASDGEIPVNTLTSNTEFRYGFGAYMKFPLVDLVNKRNLQKIGKLEIEKAQKMAESEREAVRDKVIHQYNDLVLKLRLFKIRSRQIETARINMQMAEKEFVNGVIPVTEYARLSEISTGVESNYEISRMDVLTALMILEETTGMKFKIKK
jgi:outer membrane protein TolC